MPIKPPVALFAILVGCAKPVAPTEAASVSPHPDLHCPALSIPAGKAPPAGHEVWCHALVQSGKWQREGPSISWHDNQQRESEGLYTRDKRTGPWQFWYPTGQSKEHGNFVGGVKEGAWISYHPDGARAAEGSMVDGKQHGAWTYWAEDGQSRTVGQWKLGHKDGVWHEMNAEDRVISERRYRDGRLVSQKGL